MGVVMSRESITPPTLTSHVADRSDADSTPEATKPLLTQTACADAARMEQWQRLTAETGYESLAAVLDEALHQAQHGKGLERHASGEAFHRQEIVRICEDLGSTQFAIGQARKKSRESLRLPADRAVAELLGAINYLAAAVIVRRRLDLTSIGPEALR